MPAPLDGLKLTSSIHSVATERSTLIEAFVGSQPLQAWRPAWAPDRFVADRQKGTVLFSKNIAHIIYTIHLRKCQDGAGGQSVLWQ